MQSRFRISALAAMTLLGTGSMAAAQGAGTPGTAGSITTPSTGAQSGVGSAPGQSTSGTTAPSPRLNQPVPNSAPGSATRLPGDNPSAPGFPGKVGR